MRIALLTLLVLVATLQGQASAALYSHRSYGVLSADGTRLLIMVGEPRMDSDEPASVKGPDGFHLLIDETFTKSGVYDAQTLEPIWQVDWYALPFELGWTDDFLNVAVVDYTAFDRGGGLRFYQQGQLIREYDWQELLTIFRSPYVLHYDCNFTWWHETFEVRGERLLFSTVQRRVATQKGDLKLPVQENYVFDLRTGQMLSRQITGRWLVWLAYLSVLLPFAGVLAFVIVRLRRPRTMAVVSG